MLVVMRYSFKLILHISSPSKHITATRASTRQGYLNNSVFGKFSPIMMKSSSNPVGLFLFINFESWARVKLSMPFLSINTIFCPNVTK